MPVSAGPAPAVSVFTMDQSTVTPPAGAPLPVEAQLLVLSADGDEPELEAIRSALDHRGTPYRVFIADSEPALTASQLASGDRGLYQATILTTSSLASDGDDDESSLSAAEWAVLANYEARFRVRRAVLAAWPDPALGFGAATATDLEDSALPVTCSAAGDLAFRDVNCERSQDLLGGAAYRARALAGVTPLLLDSSDRALAVTRVGPDGRESLLLMFRQSSSWLHSLVLAQGVISWATGGTYLGQRQVTLAAQIDDTFLGSAVYRLDADDLRAGRAWLQRRRATATTPDFRLAWAYNAIGADAEDDFTAEAIAQQQDWYWISHTYSHRGLDDTDYETTYQELADNRAAVLALGLHNLDDEDLVTPNVSGLVNPDAMRAAVDFGIRFAVTDTSYPGCDNPSPNTAFYDVVEPRLLLIPRRPTNLDYHDSTPEQWTDRYNDHYRDYWGRDLTYAEILDIESDYLVVYLLNGELDPWMFHQANMRAYDGVHALLGDLIETTLGKLERRLDLEVRTPDHADLGQRFADRARADTAGVRATLLRGRALLLDAAEPAVVAVTGLRADDGEDYAGEVIGTVAVGPGRTTCVPLDPEGEGCTPAPTRVGGPGAALPLPTGYCNASSLPQDPDAGVPVDAALADARPPDAAPLVDARPVDAAPLVDARPVDAAPPVDARPADAAPPPPDAAPPPPDAAPPPPDAAPPPPDAAPLPPDAAPPPPDAAPPPPDAAPPPPDAAALPPDAAPSPPDAAAPPPDAAPTVYVPSLLEPLTQQMGLAPRPVLYAPSLLEPLTQQMGLAPRPSPSPPPEDSGGCSTTPGSAPAPLLPALGLLVLATLRLRRRAATTR